MQHRLSAITLHGSEAVFLADLLRYEKPVYFDPSDGLISTGDEPVGEEESLLNRHRD